MDVNVEDASPGLDIVFDREFRPCDTGEADEDIDAVEFPRDVRNGLVNRLFDRDIHILKTDRQLPFFFSLPAGTIKVLYSLHPHLLINVKNSQYLDAMLKESPGTGEAETLGSAGHWRSKLSPRTSLSFIRQGWLIPTDSSLASQGKTSRCSSSGALVRMQDIWY